MRKPIATMFLFLLIAGAVVYGTTRLGLSDDGEKALRPEPDVKALIDRLGETDFAVRKKAEEEILALGSEARDALEEAMKSHPDAHVRFEAERLLNRLAEPAPEGRLAPAPEDEAMRGFGAEVRDMLRRLSEHGLLRVEDLDRWSKMFSGGLQPGDPFGTRSLSRTEDGKTVRFDQGADGRVKVEIVRDGKSEVFEAGSVEELKEKFPEVYAEVEPLLGSVRIEIGGAPFDDWFRGLRPFGSQRGFRAPPWSGEPPAGIVPRTGAPGGFRLGVWVGEMTEALRHHLKLGLNEGVLVEEVVPGSIAARMGLRRLDVIVRVNGRTVGAAEDIRAVLGGVEEGSTVKAEVIRQGAPLELMSTK
ncbi:MAG: PDZ domain-containing protein [Planctomycetes bacterium]|jgi:hypothetical protein|nr:PDZ domain-containing protein [Planctomycetota bacterium]